MRTLGHLMGAIALVLAGTVTNAIAGQPVPEISPSSLSAGLALVAGGVLLARARWRKK